MLVGDFNHFPLTSLMPTDRSASQQNVVKENSADQHPAVRLTSKTGKL
jgi:hypothetical protein